MFLIANCTFVSATSIKNGTFSLQIYTYHFSQITLVVLHNVYCCILFRTAKSLKFRMISILFCLCVISTQIYALQCICPLFMCRISRPALSYPCVVQHVSHLKMTIENIHNFMVKTIQIQFSERPTQRYIQVLFQM